MIKPGKLAAATLLSILLAAAGRAQQALPATEWIDLAQLEQGKILVDIVNEGQFQGRVQAAVRIDASPEQIWDVMTNCAAAPEFIPGVLRCELVETLEQGRTQLFRQEVKYSWYLPRLSYVFRLDYFPYRQIDFKRISGRPRKLEGSWWLQAEAGATRVIYSLDLDPGFLVPKFLVRRALRKDLPKVLEALRQRVEEPMSQGASAAL